jgi:membrane protease YdiL (CAAX protease family)
MKAPPRLPGRRRYPLFLALAFGLLVAAVFFLFNPENTRFYPKCILYQWTHIKCPGCGGLRATYQLVHGHVGTAFHYNALFVSLLPVAVWMGVVWAVRRWTGRLWPYVFLKSGWGWALLVATLVFTVVRNFFDF